MACIVITICAVLVLALVYPALILAGRADDARGYDYADDEDDFPF